MVVADGYRDAVQPGAVPRSRHDEVETGGEAHPHPDVVRHRADKLRELHQHPAGLLVFFE